MVRLVLFLKTVPKAVILFWIALLLSGELGMANASSSSTEIKDRIEQKRAKAKAVQERIARSREKVKELGASEAPISQELEGLNRALNSSQVRLRQIRSEIKRLGGRREALMSDRQRVLHDIDDLETNAMQRLASLYKLGNVGVAPFLFSSDSFFDLWQRREALERILHYDTALWDRLHTARKRLEDLSQKLQDQKRQQEDLLTKAQEEGASIANKRAKRAKLLASIRQAKEHTMATIASLKQSAKELDQALRRLEKKARPPSAASSRGTGAFLASKGSLPLPADGEIVGSFGPHRKDGQYNIQSHRTGININARFGSPVWAVCTGKVIYADWFKGYGNIMIIDHDDHYYTLYGQLEQLLRQKGEEVKSGEPIGTVGDTGTLCGPGLYFEIRHHGEPLNPVIWFKK